MSYSDSSVFGLVDAVVVVPPVDVCVDVPGFLDSHLAIASCGNIVAVDYVLGVVVDVAVAVVVAWASSYSVSLDIFVLVVVDFFVG